MYKPIEDTILNVVGKVSAIFVIISLTKNIMCFYLLLNYIFAFFSDF